jgi:hypothetical protein
MPPPANQKWLTKLFASIEDMPEEVYGSPEHAIELSMAMSLKRIADTLERLGPILRRPPRT